MKKASIAIALGVISALAGCSNRVADMTIGSTKNYNINAAKFIKGPRVVGKDIRPVIIFPIGSPNIKTAMDKAIEQDKCAVGLADVVVRTVNYSFLIGAIGHEVEGSLIIDASQLGCEHRA